MITIRTEYSGGDRYHVRIARDGQWIETLPASRATVIRIRNRACERYAEEASEVQAGEIPAAFDMR